MYTTPAPSPPGGSKLQDLLKKVATPTDKAAGPTASTAASAPVEPINLDAEAEELEVRLLREMLES
jgi:hypothetical protein